MILVEEKNGLFLDIKTQKAGNIIFDYLSKEIKETNTFIEESTFIISNNNKLLRIDKQLNINPRKGDQQLFHIRKAKNDEITIENPVLSTLSLDNTDSLNYKLWFIINSEPKQNEINNDDYYLNIDDILKFGNVKYIIPEIHINNIENKIEDKSSEVKTENNNLYDISGLNKSSPKFSVTIPEIKTYHESLDENSDIKCYLCSKNNCSNDNPIIKFCDCNFVHFKCLKNNIKMTKIVTKDGNVINYYIHMAFCKDCQKFYPLRFKLGEKTFELFDIEKPTEEDYIILESLEKKVYYGYIKLIHVIKFNQNNISVSVGRKKSCDVIIRDPSVSRDHAILKFDKEKQRILIKDKSAKYGTLVLIKKAIKINSNKIQIQIGKNIIEAQKMKFGEFEKIKDKKKTKYPLPKE